MNLRYIMWWLILLSSVYNAHQEMSLSTEVLSGSDNFTNSTEAKHATDLLHIDVSKTGRPLIIIGCILLIGFLKPVFEYLHRIPHSVLLLLFGILAGFGLSYVFGELFLEPDWFFIYLLPPIVLEAGYFLRNKAFFHNIGTISTYAVIGTLFNTFAIASTHYALRSYYITTDTTSNESYMKVELSFLEILVFSTLISAVDPVAVLCVFEDIHVNELLYICVFGESLLNDAVTIVLYQTVMNMIVAKPDLTSVAVYGKSVATFCFVSFGGIGLGIIGGLVTALCMRILANHQVVQPILMILMPLIFYLFTDTFHLSGILAIVTCGILIKNYMKGNVCDQMHFAVEYLYKMASSYSESLIFVFLGVSVVSENHVYNWLFISVTLVSCLVYRFIGVYLLTFFLNKFRYEDEQISVEDQFVMAYGGIRGAVCYGLVMSIPDGLIPSKHMFVTTTLAVIMFTTMLQGTTIKFLVNKLKVKRSKLFGKTEEKKKGVFDQLAYEVNKNLINFVENLTELHGENWFYRKLMEFDTHILKHFLVAYYQPKSIDILERHMEIEITEYAMSVKRAGGNSFAGIVSNASMDQLHLPTSKSEMFASGFDAHLLVPPARPISIAQPTAPPVQVGAAIPRNTSVSGLVAQAFENTEMQRSGRGKRRSLYSRHLMDVPASPAPICDRLDSETSVDGEDVSYTFTFPYAKGANHRMANSIRQFSRSLKDPNRAHLSPTRADTVRVVTQRPSFAKETRAPKRADTMKPRFTIVDEESGTPPPQPKATNLRGRGERTITGSHKTFTIGEDKRELLAIKEDEVESHK